MTTTGNNVITNLINAPTMIPLSVVSPVQMQTERPCDQEPCSVPGVVSSAPTASQVLVPSTPLMDSVVSQPATAVLHRSVSDASIEPTATVAAGLHPHLGSGVEPMSVLPATASSSSPPEEPVSGGTDPCPATSVFAAPSHAPVPDSSPASDTAALPAPTAHPRTRLQDGTIRYANSAASSEPYTVQEALSSPVWKAAIDEEYNALMRNQTWCVVPPQPSCNLIDCKWFYKIKHKADGSVDRHKARLVAKGFK
jgi:hypothetical protein